MAIKVMADSGGTITYSAAEIGGAFNTFAGGSDYIIGDISSEMEITYSSTSLQVSIAPGRAVVCGRPVTVDSAETLNIGASQSDGVYIVLRVDTTRPIGTEGYFTYVTQSQLKEDNLNAANGIHDLVLALVKTDASGVTSYQDQRNITTVSGGARFRIIKDENGQILSEPIIFEIVAVAQSNS